MRSVSQSPSGRGTMNRLPLRGFCWALGLLCIGVLPSCVDRETVLGNATTTDNAGGAPAESPPCVYPGQPTLVINEVVTKNEGTSVDEDGDVDDWIELINNGPDPLSLDEYHIIAGNDRARLPNRRLRANERIVLWADGSTSAADTHLPFRLSASGESLSLERCGAVLASHDVPPLAANHAYARIPDGNGEFEECRYASPNRENPDPCEPPPPPSLVDTTTFAPYQWTLPHPAIRSPLAISELALLPARFVELQNTSASVLPLSDFTLTIAATRPGQPYPGRDAGRSLDLSPYGSLEPGELLTLDVTDADTQALASKSFEGVVTVFDPSGLVVDRVDFTEWPENAGLAVIPEYPGRHVFCTPVTPGTDNDACRILAHREVGNRVRHLRTLGDFDALSEGGEELGMRSVKFILDMEGDDAVHLLSSSAWWLHYDFVREVIEGLPHLDICLAADRAIFNRGWYDFSATEYRQQTGRRYLLGTLVHHGGPDLFTMEFALGDAITPEDMRRALFRVTENVLVPELFAIRPQDDDQTARVTSIDGSVPAVGPNAPFVGVTQQPLTQGVAYGTLQFFQADELAAASLGPDVIAVTDDVPNEIPLVGGLITEAFQTPLSHVNILSQNRGTPNLALASARHDERIAPLLDSLVRLEVMADGFKIEPATMEEATLFWESHFSNNPTAAPRIDTEPRDPIDLRDASLQSLPSIGAKAAQLAELAKLAPLSADACPLGGGFAVPKDAFAIPVSHFVDHLESSGALGLLLALENDASMKLDRIRRGEQLQQIRTAILEAPVATELLEAVTAQIRTRFGDQVVRLRSSSNAEDLPGFNGAGLYQSASAQLDEPDATVEDAIRTVWASLYRDRGYDERTLYGVDQTQVAMGVLIHAALEDEMANGVVITRNLYDPMRGDIYTVNAQLGEASVTNPAPGVTTEQFIYRVPPRFPLTTTMTLSSLAEPANVLSEPETTNLGCSATFVNQQLRPLFDPTSTLPHYALDIEWKLMGPNRSLVFKQVRPYPFPESTAATQCHEL